MASSNKSFEDRINKEFKDIQSPGFTFVDGCIKFQDKQYSFCRNLGAGGYGAVYEYQNKDNKKDSIVIKKYHNQDEDKSALIIVRNNDKKHEEESRMLAMNSAIMFNIVYGMGACNFQNGVYVLMPKIGGTPLVDEFIGSEERFIQLFLATMLSIKKLQNKKIVHRDINGWNALVSRRESKSDLPFDVKFVDFDMAQLSEETVAPWGWERETMYGRPCDSKEIKIYEDVYSVKCMFKKLFQVGKYPYNIFGLNRGMLAKFCNARSKDEKDLNVDFAIAELRKLLSASTIEKIKALGDKEIKERLQILLEEENFKFKEVLELLEQHYLPYKELYKRLLSLTRDVYRENRFEKLGAITYTGWGSFWGGHSKKEKEEAFSRFQDIIKGNGDTYQELLSARSSVAALREGELGVIMAHTIKAYQP